MTKARSDRDYLTDALNQPVVWLALALALAVSLLAMFGE